MALMNSHDMPLRSPGLWAAGRSRARFWGIGAAFVAIYFALNLMTEWHDFDRLGITLWSPDDGLSLALLIESLAFAPFVFLGAILVDLSIAGVHRSIGVTIVGRAVLTIAYVGLAFILKNRLKFDVRQFRLPDVVTFLLLVPVCAAVSSLIYCGVLYLGGELPGDKLFVAMGHCWIGDALGMVTVIPATTAVFTYLSAARGAGLATHCLPFSSSFLGYALDLRLWSESATNYTICSICFFCRSSGWRCGKGMPASRSRW